MDRYLPQTRSQEMAVYLGLLVVQTAAATFLFWTIFPLFRRMLTQLGELQDLTLSAEISILSGALLLHCAYWSRCRWIAAHAPFHSVFIGHVIQFAGRTSFFFGSALFSVIFFKHVPELAMWPTVEQAALKGLTVIWVLFALFCYSLELDRLGKAMEAAPETETLPGA